MTTGWAVVDEAGNIDIRTVSDTRRAAIVNWLVTHGTMVFNHTTDEQIEDLWSIKSGRNICTIVTIALTER